MITLSQDNKSFFYKDKRWKLDYVLVEDYGLVRVFPYRTEVVKKKFLFFFTREVNKKIYLDFLEKNYVLFLEHELNYVGFHDLLLKKLTVELDKFNSKNEIKNKITQLNAEESVEDKIKNELSL